MTTPLETQFFKWILKEMKSIGLRSILSFGAMVLSFVVIHRMLGEFTHGVVWIDNEWRDAVTPVAAVIGTSVFGFARHRVNRGAAHHKDPQPATVQVNVSSVESSPSGVDLQSVSVTSVAPPKPQNAHRRPSSHAVAIFWAAGLVVFVSVYIALYHSYVLPLDENDRNILAENSGVTNITAEAGSGTNTVPAHKAENLGLVLPICNSGCRVLADYMDAIRTNYPGVPPLEYIMNHNLQWLHDCLSRDCFKAVGASKVLLFFCYMLIFVCASAAAGYSFGPAELIAELAHR